MNEDLVKLHRRRGVIKARLTRARRFLELKPNACKNELTVRLNDINAAIEDEEIQRMDLENNGFELQATYQDRIDELATSVSIQNTNVELPTDNRRRGRLRPLDMPKFDGQVSEALVGKATGVLDSIKVIGENYQLAWETLTKRNLLDCTQKQIKALKAFNVPTEHWDLVIIHLITSRLASETKTLWDSSLKTDDLPTLKDLENFLENRCYVLSNKIIEKSKKSHHEIKTNLFVKVEKSSENAITCKMCPRAFSCSICKAEHNSLLHFEEESINSKDSISVLRSSQTNLHTANNVFNQVLLPTAKIIVEDANGIAYNCRALLDSGSQSNFISKRLADKIGVELRRENTLINGLNYSKSNTLFRIDSIETKDWTFLERFRLADPTFFMPGKIEVLLGAEWYEEVHQEGIFKEDDRFPTLRKSVFGWTVIELLNQIRKFWEIEEIVDYEKHNDHPCEIIFRKTSERESDGTFVVQLPFDANLSDKKLGNSYDTAKRRLLQLEKKLYSNNLFEKYRAVIEEYINLGYFDKLSNDQIKRLPEESYYLPHHAVIKESSCTTKLRVVFDGSCKSSTGFSLNDLLLNGPVVQDDLFSILIRFRFHRIAFVADIEKMYRMIRVSEKHTDYQRIYGDQILKMKLLSTVVIE
ncbi:uncharacterized protein LOC122524519 [Polistes fuscatus]|uniref:uncharacterized protein LOC122524519 n=1 Tax=Polistes fuscatus TaxID=30207 RepID=UPI001CA8C7C5|nr:uncharacterized protein LOC122524519 [Polistes fuscatus]